MTCSLGTLPARSTAEVAIIVTPTAVRTLVNTASVTSVEVDADTRNNTVITTTIVREGSADLSVTSSASPDPIMPGGALTYTIDVMNNGPSTADMILTDSLPTGETLVSATPTNGSCTGTSVVTCHLGVEPERSVRPGHDRRHRHRVRHVDEHGNGDEHRARSQHTERRDSPSARGPVECVRDSAA